MSMTRCTIGRALEPGIAPTTATAFEYSPATPHLYQIREGIAALGVENHCSGWYVDFDITAVGAMAIDRPSRFTGFGAKQGPGLQIGEGVQVFTDIEPDVATVAAVAAVGSTTRYVFLTSERDGTGTAGAGLDFEGCAIGESGHVVT